MHLQNWAVGRLSLSLAAIFLAAMAAGCVAIDSQKPIQITKQSEAWLNKYFEQIGPVGNGAFAVSTDGRYAYYTYCLDTICGGGWSMSQHALLGCERGSKSDCVLLASSRNMLRRYSVIGQEITTTSTTSTSSQESVPVAVTRPKKEVTAAALSGETLRGHVIGNTFSGYDDERIHWIVYFDVDQKVKAKAGDRPLAGAWQISGDRLCVDFAGSLDDWCAVIKGDDEAVDIYRDGKLRYSMTHSATIPGNPWKL
jgi:hypothetical protein